MIRQTVLVTGGAGFIGSHLCQRLLGKNFKVICFDNLSTGSLNNLQKIQPHINFIKGDCNDYNQLKIVFEKNKIDIVFHYAAVVGVKRTLENPLAVLNDLEGIRHILELSHLHQIKKVIFASSSEVYGEPVEIPEVEDGHVNAKLPYAVVKLAGEKLMEAYFKMYNLNTTSLRFFNVYGPNQESSDYGFVVGIFINQVLENIAPTIFGDGTQTRDFVYIEDNIEAALLTIDAPLTAGEVINIGTGRPVTILDLAEEIIELADKQGILKPQFIESNRNDIKHRFPDVSKMQKLLKFRPHYKLSEGLSQTLAWYKKIT
ncbi:MAG: udp-glucose 4-epimerase [Candidatus Peregrinibacteria bacterium GW2011_GWF2_39_17]|nr:MAG: udp-glucose 4-epimerase [Candidatus Peregrinibacteria bacterium GW2011_GWF2_39_17]HCW32585.1 epimerase [Candidatus Peregrinibacteria bacterium]